MRAASGTRIIGLLALVLAAWTAQAAPAKPAALARDTASPVVLRAFSSVKLDSFRHSADFKYMLPPDQARSFWQLVRRWLRFIVERFFDVALGTATGRIILGLLLVGLVIYFVTRLTGMRSPLYQGNGRGRGDAVFVTEDELHEVDFEKVISAAVETGNLRLAVRLWYLKTLKALSDTQKINWRPGKTNHAYLSELAGTPYASFFGRLTRDFEYCWYGDGEVEASRYGTLEQEFVMFNREIERS